MKVKELIETLKRLDPDKEVYLSYTDPTDYLYRTPLRTNEIEEEKVYIKTITKEDEYGDPYEFDVEKDIVNIEFLEYLADEELNHNLPF
jgi:hypothetical protein